MADQRAMSGGRWGAAFALAVAVAACGGDPPRPPPKDKPKAAEAEAAPDPAAALPEGVLGENPKWRPIQPLFEAYRKREIAAVTDFSLDNTTQFIEKPIIQETPEAEQGTDEAADVPQLDPDNCATKTGVDNYRLVMLMSGRAQPKALMVDGSGVDCVVGRGDALGTEGGHVTAITQYEVIVLVPGRDKPLKLSILPPLSIGEPADGEGAP